MTGRAVLFISHGSRSPAARSEVEAMAALLRERTGARIFEIAFLDVETPSIPDGVRACVEKGAAEVDVLLNFLNSGNHVMKDIPAILEAERKKHPGLSFRLTPPIGAHPRIPDLFMDYLG